MRDKGIGIVSEGPTDQISLKKLIPAAITTLGQEDFVAVQPSADRTSGGNIDGGWTKIQKWCLNNPPELRRQLAVGGGLFESSGSSGRSWDALLVLMDTDICERKDFQRQANISSDNFDLSSPVGRAEYVEAVLREWLWPTGIDNADLSWTILAPAVEAVETWLVAGLTEEQDPESIKDIGLSLLKADHTSRGRIPPTNAKKMKKDPDRYERIATRAAENIATIMARCPHFVAMLKKLSVL